MGVAGGGGGFSLLGCLGSVLFLSDDVSLGLFISRFVLKKWLILRLVFVLKNGLSIIAVHFDFSPIEDDGASDWSHFTTAGYVTTAG